ncbi:hypothetical protein [Chitinophaga sp. RAB17]|uniref:hypothetical protein n=1 Tax=Chitinophaga sp. RAB17 TaxID=3233049 RepID=UPI003F936482
MVDRMLTGIPSPGQFETIVTHYRYFSRYKAAGSQTDNMMKECLMLNDKIADDKPVASPHIDWLHSGLHKIIGR